MNEIFTKLAAPFSPQDVEWRAGATNANKTQALALAYITSRAVMDRLDEVIGPMNWRDDFKPGPNGGLICGISLRIDNEWITKWDGAENTSFEAIKGGLSDAFKRAAVKWGIGRYLYHLPNAWVPCEVHGKTVVLKSTPPLSSDPAPDRFDAAAPAAEFPGEKSKPSNGRRSWDVALVDALVKENLAANASAAVILLNASNLSRDVSLAEALAWARAQG